MRFLRGITALLLLTALLAGIPAVLVLVVGNPIPSLDQLISGLTVPALVGDFVIRHVLPLIGWVAWLLFAVGFVVELGPRVRGIDAPRLPAIGWAQGTAGALLGAVVLMFVGSTGALTPAAEAAPMEQRTAAASQQVQPAPEEEPPVAPQVTTQVVEQEVTVQPGNTLWGIAETHLGSGDRWGEIYNATQGEAQPVGGPISNPGLIYPGQIVDVPVVETVTAPAPAAPAEAPAPAPVDDDAGAGASTTEATGEAGAAAASKDGASSTRTSEQQGVDEDAEPAAFDFAPMMRTAGGIGVVLAAGLLGVLGVRRMRQQSRRRPGERIAMPDATAHSFELELNMVAEPIVMDHVDAALRFLAQWAQGSGRPLPRLYAVRLASDELSFYLQEPMALPAPFRSVSDDHTAWVVDVAGIPDLTDAPSSPYPALVTIGDDPSGAHVLVDLESIDALRVAGDAAIATGALTALAMELATTSWGDTMQVTLVGVAPSLPNVLGRERLRHVDDVDALLVELRAQALQAAASIEDLDVDDIPAARTRDAEAEAWGPEIVILGTTPTEEQRAELEQLVTQVPRVGIATVGTDAITGDWVLTIESAQSASLAPLDLPIAPQIVTEEEYRQVVACLETTELASVPGPEWAQSIDEHEPAPAAESPLPDADEPQTITAPVAIDAPAGPLLRLLGHVELEGARGTAGPQLSRYTELVAFLSLTPGANSVEIHEAMWPGERADNPTKRQNRNRLVNLTRKWLGKTDAQEDYLPPSTPKGSDYEFRLHEDVTTDWDQWQQLIGADIVSTDSARIVAALELVKGVPFQGVRDRYYGWAEEHRRQMIAAIGDAAYELAQRGLEPETRNIANVRYAAGIGRMIDPLNERFWRAAMRAEKVAGNLDEANRIVDAFYAELDRFEEGTEPEDRRTVELIEDIRGRRLARR